MKRNALGTLAAALPAALAACAGPAAEDDAAISIQTAPAEVRDMRITAEATGELEPVLRVEVKSKASGEILDLYVDSGDNVEPGALLARVDPRDVQNAYDQANADLDVARARIEVAEAQQTRSQELLESDVITAQEFESSKLEYANAQAALVRAETNLELATLRLTDVTIRAPMAGTILEKQVEYGQVIQSATQNVSGGTTLFIMANLDDMRVRTLVDETDVGQLSAGMAATVTVEAFPDRTFRGEIEKIEPQAVVEQNVTMFPVIVLLDNRAGILKPGMNAEVEVLVDERLAALTVPNNAVVQPQELAPAAEVLGLDPQMMSIDRGVWSDLMAQAASRSGRPANGRTAGDAMAPGPGEGAGGGEGRPMADMRARIQSGEISPDSARALFAAMRQQMGRWPGRRGRERRRPGRIRRWPRRVRRQHDGRDGRLHRRPRLHARRGVRGRRDRRDRAARRGHGGERLGSRRDPGRPGRGRTAGADRRGAASGAAAGEDGADARPLPTLLARPRRRAVQQP